MIVINGKFLTQQLTGVQRFALEMTMELLALRNNIQIAVPSLEKLVQPIEGLPVIHVGKSTGVIWEQRELPRWLKKQGSPLLLNFCNSGPILYKPAITTIHDLATILHPEWFSKFFALAYQRMLPILAKRSEYVLTVSNQIKNELVKEFNLAPDNIKLVYNGLPKLYLDDLHGFQTFQKKRQILTVGSFDPRKNLDLLVQSFSKLDLPSDWKLVIVGRNSDVFRFKELEIAENVKDKIIIHTEITDLELLNLYKQSEVFVSLSSYEGFGIPVLEAIAANCKVLVADIPVFRELFAGYVQFTPLDMTNVIKELGSIIATDNITQNDQLLLEKYSFRKSALVLDKLITGYIS